MHTYEANIALNGQHWARVELGAGIRAAALSQFGTLAARFPIAAGWSLTLTEYEPRTGTQLINAGLRNLATAQIIEVLADSGYSQTGITSTEYLDSEHRGSGELVARYRITFYDEAGMEDEGDVFVWSEGGKLRADF